MSDNKSASFGDVAAGLAAGVVGAAVLVAMRRFDRKYAPRTIGDDDRDSDWIAPLGYGAILGMLYGSLNGRSRRSRLADGVKLAGSLMASQLLDRPSMLKLFKFARDGDLPRLFGEMLRHLTYGVATSIAFGWIDDRV